MPVVAGSSVRFDSVRKSVAGAGNYEFKYTFENRGNSVLRLSVYQINASGEYKKDKNYYDYEKSLPCRN